MKRVFVCSPYRGIDKQQRRRYNTYLRRAMLDCLKRGEAPFAPHALYPVILDDSDASERALGMMCGHLWIQGAEALVAYIDYGISEGMQLDLVEASRHGKPVEMRYILRGSGHRNTGLRSHKDKC